MIHLLNYYQFNVTYIRYINITNFCVFYVHYEYFYHNPKSTTFHFSLFYNFFQIYLDYDYDANDHILFGFYHHFADFETIVLQDFIEALVFIFVLIYFHNFVYISFMVRLVDLQNSFSLKIFVIL
jgi:hypothetical protein